MNDKYEELDNIMNSKLEEVKTCDFNRLLEICKEENLDSEELEEKELRESLIEYFKEELEY